jgi:hypothetical protein
VTLHTQGKRPEVPFTLGVGPCIQGWDEADWDAYDAGFAQWLDIADVAPVAAGVGYLYLIGFHTAVVRVGQTWDPKLALIQQRREASEYGVVLVDFWLSTGHRNSLRNKADLITACARVGTVLKLEYIHGVTFSGIVAGAEAMDYDTGPSAHSRWRL